MSPVAQPQAGGRGRSDYHDRAAGSVADRPFSPAHLALRITAEDEQPWILARHLAYINRRIVEVATSPYPRFLIIETPPRHGKSELVSRYTPAWYLGTWPHKQIMLVSYESDFAKLWGRGARNILEEHGEDLFGVSVARDSSAAGRWHTTRGGTMIATGMEGSLTGRGGHLIVIDDPVKGWLEAQSDAYRHNQWEWYTGTLRSRLMKNGSIIIVTTRWHEDDLAGRCIKQSEEDPEADQWEVVRIPAIAEHPDPATGYLEEDVLGRAPGQALWPELYDEKSLKQIEASVGPLVWESAYQQRPTKREGDMFKVHMWGSVPALPWGSKVVTRVDLAGTEKKARSSDPDWTACVTMVRTPDGRTIIAYADRIRAEELEVQAFVRAYCSRVLARFGSRAVRVEREPGSAGKMLASQWTREVLPEYDCHFLRSSGDKTTRAKPFAAQQQAGNVFLLVTGDMAYDAWVAPYVEEHRQFDKGAHDDWVDASSHAYLDLVEGQVSTHVRHDRRLRGRR